MAEHFELARIHIWGLHLWRPGLGRDKALALLANPERSHLNQRVIDRLIQYGCLAEARGTLALTAAGLAAVHERPDVIARIRAKEVA